MCWKDTPTPSLTASDLSKLHWIVCRLPHWSLNTRHHASFSLQSSFFPAIQCNEQLLYTFSFAHQIPIRQVLAVESAESVYQVYWRPDQSQTDLRAQASRSRQEEEVEQRTTGGREGGETRVQTRGEQQQ